MTTIEVLPFVNINGPKCTCMDPTDSEFMYCGTSSGIYRINIATKATTAYFTGAANITSIVFDNNNNLYGASGFSAIIKITPDKVVSTFYDTNANPVRYFPAYMCFDRENEIFYSSDQFSPKIFKIDINGNASSYANNTSRFNLNTLVLDQSTKDIYAANTNGECVTKTNSTGTTSIYANFSNVLWGKPIGIDYNGFVFNCSTVSSSIIYQILPNQNVTPLFSSNLINGTYSIMSGPVDNDRDTLYITTGNSIVKMLLPHITVEPVFNKPLGGPNFSLNATSSSPIQIQYESSNPSVAEVDSNGNITIVSIGTCVITLVQYSDIIYQQDAIVAYAKSRINILSTIQVQSTFNKILGDSVFSLNATSNSLLPIEYESSNPSIAEVDSSGNVTIVSAGTCNILLKQYIDGVVIGSAQSEINVYAKPPFGNVTAMSYDANNDLLYVCSNNQYPYNFITINNDGSSNSLNIATTNADIQTINIVTDPYMIEPTIYVGGTFDSLSGNQKNVNVSELKNTYIEYSTIHLSVNNQFVDNVEYDQTIGVMTTNTGKPFEISKK